MKTILKSIFLFSVLFATGCASGPKYVEMVQSIPELSPDKGRIYIYRNSALGAAVKPDVKVNGEVIGSSDPMGFYFVDLSPGNYKMTTRTEVERSLSFILDAGQTRYVKLNISMGFFVGHVYPELVEESVGQNEIQACAFVGKIRYKQVSNKSQPEKLADVKNADATDGQFIKYKNGIVYDTKTGLEWVAGPESTRLPDGAKYWVSRLDIDGGGWRMPSVNELNSLYVKNSNTKNMTGLLKAEAWHIFSKDANRYAWKGFNFRSSRPFAIRDNPNDSDDDPDIDLKFRGFAVRSQK